MQTTISKPSQIQGFQKTQEFDREKRREDLGSDSKIRDTGMDGIEHTRNEFSFI